MGFNGIKHQDARSTETSNIRQSCHNLCQIGLNCFKGLLGGG